VKEAITNINRIDKMKLDAGEKFFTSSAIWKMKKVISEINKEEVKEAAAWEEVYWRAEFDMDMNSSRQKEVEKVLANTFVHLKRNRLLVEDTELIWKNFTEEWVEDNAMDCSVMNEYEMVEQSSSLELVKEKSQDFLQKMEMEIWEVKLMKIWKWDAFEQENTDTQEVEVSSEMEISDRVRSVLMTKEEYMQEGWKMGRMVDKVMVEGTFEDLTKKIEVLNSVNTKSTGSWLASASSSSTSKMEKTNRAVKGKGIADEKQMVENHKVILQVAESSLAEAKEALERISCYSKMRHSQILKFSDKEETLEKRMLSGKEWLLPERSN